MILSAYQPRPFPCLHWWNRMLQVDVFVIMDDAQFKRQSWQQRYEVWMHDHPLRRTIPVDRSTLFHPINEVKVAEGRWREKHLKTLKQCYGGEPNFDEYYHLAEHSLKYSLLGDISLTFISDIKEALGIKADIAYSSHLNIESRASDYLVDLCDLFSADTYLCGRVGYENYLETEKFEDAGIKVEVQTWPCRYDRGDISILDPLMRFGEEARRWIG